MKKMINDTINLDELNGATLGTWINTLFQLQDEVGKSATISSFAHADTYHDIGCTIEISYERLENDNEDLNSEDLKIEKIKNFAADFGVTIKSVNFL